MQELVIVCSIATPIASAVAVVVANRVDMSWLKQSLSECKRRLNRLERIVFKSEV